MIPRCPRCGARMVQRHNAASGQAFWGCPTFPRCRGTVAADAPPPDPPGTDPWSSQGQALATLQQQLRQVTRERDTLQAGYAQLLAEVRLSLWQLRLLARLLARYDLPWLLAQDVVELSADERAYLVALLGAWHVGKRRTRGTQKAGRPGNGGRQSTRGA